MRPDADRLRQELDRAGSLMREIEIDMRATPTPLARRIRLRFRQNELEAYCRGLRYALGEAGELGEAPPVR